MVRRSLQKVCLATKDERKRMEFMRRMLADLGRRFGPDFVPSFHTINENKILVEVTGNPDPYRRKKLHVIRMAKRCLPYFKSYVESGGEGYELFRRALLVSLCGNKIEISAPQHKVDVGDLRGAITECIRGGLAVDDTRKIFRKVESAGRIMFITDNCGEAVLDTLLLAELRKYAEVVIAVSSKPIEDDVSIGEAKLIGLERYGRVVGRGGATQGVNKKENSRTFWKLMRGSDLIVAKGMSCLETLTEYPGISRGRTAFLLTVKCRTMSRNIGVGVGGNVAWLYPHGGK